MCICVNYLYDGIRTAAINIAVRPVHHVIDDVVAPRPVAFVGFVRVATVVSRRWLTAVRERGVGSCLAYTWPSSTCAPAICVSATHPTHVMISLLVIIVTVAAWNKYITRFSDLGLVSVDGSLSLCHILLISRQFNPLSFFRSRNSNFAFGCCLRHISLNYSKFLKPLYR